MKKHFTKQFYFALFTTFIGGFIELYSIKTRGIYAAMMTGNLISIFTNLIEDNYYLSLSYLLVIITFFIGCVICQVIMHNLRVKKETFNLIILILEIIFLLSSICIPMEDTKSFSIYNLIAELFLALFGSFQFTSFQTFEGESFVSTMMTSVLRNISLNLTLSIKNKDKDRLYVFIEYLILLIFFVLGFLTFYLIFKYVNINDNQLFLRLILLIPVSIIAFVLIPLNYKKEKMNSELN